MKNVKKLFAVAVVLTALVSVGGTGVAVAADCPPHNPIDSLMDIATEYGEHFVPAFDTDGELLYDSNGRLVLKKCKTSLYWYKRGISCKTCGWFIEEYWYSEDHPKHSSTYCQGAYIK